MTGFITMIRDVSDVVIDVSHTTIINTSNIAIVAAAYAQDSWKSLRGGTPSLPLLEPSANDISGILLGTTIIQGTDLSGITIGDNCTASGEYAVAMGWGADASGTEGFVYRDICSNVFAFDSGPPAVLRVNHQDPDAGGGTGGDLSQNMLSDFDASGTIETSGVILAPIHSAEGSSQSVITELDPSKNPLMTKGMMWINEAQDASSGWSSVTSMDVSRTSLPGCAALGGKLYVAGGAPNLLGSQAFRSCEVYDPIANSWSAIADMNDKRVSFKLVALLGKLYAVGGGDNAQAAAAALTAEVYDPSANSWSYIAPPPAGDGNLVMASMAGAVCGKLYVIGSCEADGSTCYEGETTDHRVMVYDPIDNSWNYVAPIPQPRHEGQVAVLGGRLYVAGGLGGPGGGGAPHDRSQYTLQIYDPISNSWSLGPEMNEARVRGNAVALGGKLYVVGGYSILPGGTYPYPAPEMYDPTNPSGGWTTMTAQPQERLAPGAAALGGKLYMVGGGTAVTIGSGAARSTVQVYDPSLVQMPQITYQGEDFYVSHARGGPKTFIIPHPEHEGKMLRHACLEAPTRGTNVYEYQITTTEDNQTTEVALPSYFKHINGRVRVYVSVVEQNEWGGFGGSVNDDLTKAIVKTEKSGTYNVMVTGVRKDPEAVAYSATENIDDPIDEKDI